VLLDLRQSLPEKVTQEMGPGPGLVMFVFEAIEEELLESLDFLNF